MTGASERPRSPAPGGRGTRQGAFAAAQALVGEVDPHAARSARQLHDRLTKPPGSLGELEAIGVWLASIAGTSPPPLPTPGAVAVFAGDHGVVASGVTAWPQEVTAQMVANIATGGAAISVLARAASASVTVIDIGVAAELGTIPGVLRRRVRPGTANLADGPAMSVEDTRRALDVGAEVAGQLVAGGARALVTGDMGIGNTTPAAALVAAFTGRPAAAVTGPGTGIDDDMLAKKMALVERAVARLAGEADPLTVLAAVGGLEHAALAGFIVGGAAARVPVVVDGVIALSGLLAAGSLAPGAVAFCRAGHRSTEPGAGAAIDHLGLRPVLDLGMRLGEGTGACLALPVIEAAARVLREMATFDAAGVVHPPH